MFTVGQKVRLLPAEMCVAMPITGHIDWWRCSAGWEQWYRGKSLSIIETSENCDCKKVAVAGSRDGAELWIPERYLMPECCDAYNI